jgi:hypothetical protein
MEQAERTAKTVYFDTNLLALIESWMEQQHRTSFSETVNALCAFYFEDKRSQK